MGIKNLVKKIWMLGKGASSLASRVILRETWGVSHVANMSLVNFVWRMVAWCFRMNSSHQDVLSVRPPGHCKVLRSPLNRWVIQRSAGIPPGYTANMTKYFEKDSERIKNDARMTTRMKDLRRLWEMVLGCTQSMANVGEIMVYSLNRGVNQPKKKIQ